MSEPPHGEYRYTPRGAPRPCTNHPGGHITRCEYFPATGRSTNATNAAGPDASAHPPVASPNTDDSDNHPPTPRGRVPPPRTRPRPLTRNGPAVMLTNATRWSLGRGNAPVPSRWQATASTECSVSAPAGRREICRGRDRRQSDRSRLQRELRTRLGLRATRALHLRSVRALCSARTPLSFTLALTTPGGIVSSERSTRSGSFIAAYRITSVPRRAAPRARPRSRWCRWLDAAPPSHVPSWPERRNIMVAEVCPALLASNEDVRRGDQGDIVARRTDTHLRCELSPPEQRQPRAGRARA
jgi:hypothetical protein